MAQRRSALGRGLGALLPEARSEVAAAPEPAPAESSPRELEVARIRPNAEQPRRRFSEEELARLADSLERYGLLQPVVVRQVHDDPNADYELVVGERRWRAARVAGLERIPATIADIASRDLLEVALVENIQRQDLNPIELALAFRGLTDTGATQQEVGERVGLDRSSVANHLRLLDLPRELQQDIEDHVITMGHAKALLQLGNPERRRQLRDRIVADGLSVRAAEAMARQLSGSSTGGRKSQRPEVVDPDVARLLDQLRDRLQTKVRISGGASRGRLEIEFYGPEELDRISSSILERA
jgi:ParB family chromosome partitioning protein